jgi:toxin FitB
MAQLIVRNLTDELVLALKLRAARATAALKKSIGRFSGRPCRARAANPLPSCWLPCRMWAKTRISHAARKTRARQTSTDMYLIDTDVLSEARKGPRADAGVRAFLDEVRKSGAQLFISVITIGEIRRGVARIRHRGDDEQALRLERWLAEILLKFEDHILPFDTDCAQMWGQLRVPHPENPLDKQIAATAHVHGLAVVTGNAAHFRSTAVSVYNPFSGSR